MEFDTQEHSVRSAPLITGCKGEELLLVNLFKHIYNFGSNKPKTVRKLKNCLQKWKSVVFVCKPSALLELLPEPTDIVIRSKNPVEVNFSLLEQSLTAAVKRKSVLSNCSVNVLCMDEACASDLDQTISDHIKTNIANTMEEVSYKAQFLLHNREKLTELVSKDIVQSLMFCVNGAMKDSDVNAKETMLGVLKHCLQNLQKFGYVQKSDDSEKIEYHLPSNFMILSLKTLLEQDMCLDFQNHRFDSLANRIDMHNCFLDQLKETFASEYDYYRASIISEALGALHKVKGGDRKGLKPLSQDSRPKYSCGNESCQCYPQSSFDHATNDVGLFHTLVNAYQGGFNSSSNVQVSANNFSASYDTVSEIRCDASTTFDQSLRKRTASHSQFEPNDEATPSKVSRGNAAGASNFDIDAALMSKDCVLEQSELISELMGLNLVYDDSQTMKCDVAQQQQQHGEIETLLTCMQSLTVNDIAEIPKDIDIPTITCVVALHNMMDSKPKTLTALMNSLKPVCKFLYVMPPHRVKKLQTKSERKRTSPKHSATRQIKLCHIFEIEKIQLTRKGFIMKDNLNRFTPKAEPFNLPFGKPKSFERSFEADIQKLNYALKRLVQYRVNQKSSTYVIAENYETPAFEKALHIWLGYIKKENKTEQEESRIHFTSKKQMYEDFAKVFFSEKHYTTDSLINMLEKEKLIKVKADGIVEYANCFYDPQCSMSVDEVQTRFSEMLLAK